MPLTSRTACLAAALLVLVRLTPAAQSAHPIELSVGLKHHESTDIREQVDFFSDPLVTMRDGYQGGALYPHLERNPSRPDVLAQILSPKSRE